MNSERIKILILTHHFFPDVGGIETNSQILATAFTGFGADVHVLTWTRFEGPNPFPFTVIRDPGLYTVFKEHTWADVVFENNPCLRLSWVKIGILLEFLTKLKITYIFGNSSRHHIDSGRAGFRKLPLIV